ncbi:DUF890 domain protein [Pyronema omphalodes]|nr:DUF890 domain protein [Pyronema omphalodes]
MHPRNPYRSYLDFKKLSIDCPEFAPYVDANSKVNFHDPAAVRCLAQCLLKRDFALNKLELPEDRLCPMIPNRIDYILWIQDIIDTSSCDILSEIDRTRQVVGIDIGTGASAIYPILACTLRPSWKMYATEIDSHSYTFAKTNIESNHLTHRIHLHQPPSSTQLLPLDLWGEQNIDFIMCNPPFYDSFTALEAATAAKKAPPNSACTGSETEMVYEGGEVAFVGRILEESLVLRTRVKWYSSLFGLRSSVDVFIGMLKERGIGNYTATEMQSGKTKRWAVAWSFGGEVEFTVSRKGIEKMVESLLKDGGLQLTTLKSRPMVWYGEVPEDTWSRAARRKKARERTAGMDMDQQSVADKDSGEKGRKYPSTDNEHGEEVFSGMGFMIEIVEDKMRIIWKRGDDGKLFESFAGMVKRKLTVDV